MNRVMLTSDGCWEYQGQRDPKGYGRFPMSGKKQLAHRAAWMLRYGDIPDGLMVCHRCDNPPCCNPHHLFLGTASDNVQDMVQKGRQNLVNPKGEDHGMAKLTSADVDEIRSTYAAGGATQRSLAEDYGICQAQVWRIVNNVCWLPS